MLLLLIALLQVTAPAPARTMAITIDDLPTASVLGEQIGRAERTTRDLLAAITRAAVPAIGFVNERKLQPAGKVDPRRVALLQQWLDAGLELGNHTFSHPDLHGVALKTFQDDVLRGETVTRRLLAAKGEKPRFFRHPFLHTGRSLEVRDGLVTIEVTTPFPGVQGARRHAAGDVGVVAARERGRRAESAHRPFRKSVLRMLDVLSDPPYPTDREPAPRPAAVRIR